MKIVVCSDNHGDKEILKKVLDDNKNASLFIHCGDSEMFDYELFPFITVKGNNDYYIDNLFRIVNIDKDNTAYIVHGHKSYLSKENMAAIAKNNNSNFFIFGHIHQPFYEYFDGVHILCPGSLSYPRSANGLTYAIIDIENNDINIKFISL